MHDHLVARLDPQPGERWLDVGAGTGGVRCGRPPRARTSPASTCAGDDREARRRARGSRSPSSSATPRSSRSRTQRSTSSSPASASFSRPITRRPPASSRGYAGDRLGFTAWRPSPELRDAVDRFEPDRREADTLSSGGGRGHRRAARRAFELESSMTCRCSTADGEEIWEFWAARRRLQADGRIARPGAARDCSGRPLEYCESYRGATGSACPGRICSRWDGER